MANSPISTLSRTANALPNLVDAVETELQAFLVTESAALAALDPALDTLASAVRDAVLGGGKRIRPVFAYWGWRAAGGTGPADAVVPALAALELLHAFALVHDDVMDCSDTRRGRPTAHRSLAEAHRRSRLGGDPQRFGESAAILVGDLCLVWADQLMGRSPMPATTLADARRAYDQMRVEAIAGQFLDILGDGAPVWTVERALRTAQLKTAGYTVVRPLHFGAALTGSSVLPRLLATFTRYGVAVGEAFQLRDDLLGAFGDAAVTGKPAGDDLASGKPTVLLQLARSRATARQLAEIDAGVPHIAEVVRATGAPAVVEDMIDERVATARRVLDSSPVPADARDALVGLAEAIAWRSS